MTDPATVQAYRLLENMIVTLELAPEAATTERELIQLVGLGRTPVREAIQRLAWEGLVQVRPRAGLKIAALRKEDWPRVIDARRGVEAVLARGAARFATKGQMDALRESGDAMRAASGRNDVAGYLLADKAIDECVGAAANNEFAARLAAPLQTHSRRFWFRFQASNLSNDAASHVAVVEAILARDEKRAEHAAGQLVDTLSGYAREAGRK